MWKAIEYISIGDAKSGTMVGGWMVRRGDGGNTREHADSIFVPMKWTPEPPKAIEDLIAQLNGGAAGERKAA